MSEEEGGGVPWGLTAAHPDVVRVAGLEPALLSEQDFESSASTNSTTPAQVWEARNLAAEFAGSIAVFVSQVCRPKR